MRSAAIRRRQRGAYIVTAAFLLLFLLGFMGIALDFGHLFVVKTELQTAMDSCALAAAQELDSQPTALDRARSAGLTAGNLNRVNMQSGTWANQGQIVAADISFRDAAYAATTSPAAARYAQCQHTQPNINGWLLKAMGAFSGGGTAFPATHSVAANAVATRASAQTTCPLPVALKPKSGGTAPDYGFAVGEWVTLLHNQPADPGGKIGWANLDTTSSTNSASVIEEQLKGFCGTRINDPLKPITSSGTMSSLVEPWNYRFGIYKKSPNFGVDPTYTYPDFSGYSYTEKNWPSKFNAWSGSGPAGVANFKSSRSASAPCAATVNACESTIDRKLNSFKDVATATQHGQYGSNRRIVTVPVVNGASQVMDYACMLMLQPLSIPFNVSDEVQLEYLGNAGDAGSPCTTSGLPGGAAGPLIPVLVR